MKKDAVMQCVLGIETSCDETGLALYHGEKGLIAHVLHSQVAIHAEYGGVVPELASRDHVRFLVPLLKELMKQSGLSQQDIDGVAYTQGPGLAGALLTGAAFGRSLAWSLGVPALGVHHMEGHLLAPMLEENAPEFPFLALLVSGGHSLLVDVLGLGEYKILGESIDDAAGEAFDKTAKLLGLGYPGGPLLAELAKQGDIHRFKFPRPMCDRAGLDFSFSGLKTFAMNTLLKLEPTQQDKADVACAFELAVCDTFRIKCQRAMQQTGHTRLVIAGGVSANLLLRQKLNELMLKLDGELFFPSLDFCTDNGAMIAYVGYQRLKNGQHEPLSFKIKPRWGIDAIDA